VAFVAVSDQNSKHGVFKLTSFFAEVVYSAGNGLENRLFSAYRLSQGNIGCRTLMLARRVASGIPANTLNALRTRSFGAIANDYGIQDA